MSREGDIVLIHYKDQPTMYARIEAIEPDIKKDWYQVTLLLLTIPTQTVTWILRAEYINGAPFTMGGNSMLLKGVERTSAQKKEKETGQSPDQKGGGKHGKVIPFKASEDRQERDE